MLLSNHRAVTRQDSVWTHMGPGLNPISIEVPESQSGSNMDPVILIQACLISAMGGPRLPDKGLTPIRPESDKG